MPSDTEIVEVLEHGDGAGARVAVLDSGVEAGHPALAGLELADDVGFEIDDCSVRAVNGGGRDVFGHGTAVAGIIRGLAPAATIGSFRVLGAGLRSRTEIVRAGAAEAIRRGYRVLNCSFGCRGMERFLMPYKQWIDESYMAGVNVVAACSNRDWREREWPGHFPSVINTDFAALEPTDLQLRPGTLVEFVAAGDGVEVAWSGGGTKRVTGSSFAAPHVTGMLLRLLSRWPQLTPLEAKSCLMRGVRAREQKGGP